MNITIYGWSIRAAPLSPYTYYGCGSLIHGRLSSSSGALDLHSLTGGTAILGNGLFMGAHPGGEPASRGIARTTTTTLARRLGPGLTDYLALPGS